MTALLTVQQLCLRAQDKSMLLQDISFTLHKGQCLALVGASGSGKSLTCQAILGLLPSSIQCSGSICYQGKELLQMSAQQARTIRGTGIGVIVQRPMQAFDPLRTLGSQFRETLCQKRSYSKDTWLQAIQPYLDELHLGQHVLHRYPAELSGGELQRCMIALTLSLEPTIVIADEPTTALDAVNQYAVVRQLQELKQKYHLTMIFVSHDLGAVQMLADTILIIEKGKAVEYGPAKQIFAQPQHSCTQTLIQTRLALSKHFQSLIQCSKGVVA